VSPYRIVIFNTFSSENVGWIAKIGHGKLMGRMEIGGGLEKDRKPHFSRARQFTGHFSPLSPSSASPSQKSWDFISTHRNNIQHFMPIAYRPAR
jgi:hypothetical protein